MLDGHKYNMCNGYRDTLDVALIEEEKEDCSFVINCNETMIGTVEDLISTICKYPEQRVRLYGGNPFLYSKLAQLCKGICHKKVKVLTTAIPKALNSLDFLDEVELVLGHFSPAKNEEVTGSYQTVKEIRDFIDHINKLSIISSIRVPLVNGYVDDLSSAIDMAKFAKAMGVSKMCFQEIYTMPDVSAIDVFPILEGMDAYHGGCVREVHLIPGFSTKVRTFCSLAQDTIQPITVGVHNVR